MKNYLKDKVPNYMIPSYFIKLDKFPLTDSGKINRKLLPIPQIQETNVENINYQGLNSEKNIYYNYGKNHLVN